MYFVTVLLQLPESIGNKLMITMVLVSFIFYPITNYLAKKIGKKIIVLMSLGLLSIIFLGIYYLGKFSLSAEVQIYALIALAELGEKRNIFLADIYEQRNNFDLVTQIKLARYLSQFPEWQNESQQLVNKLQQSIY